MPTCKRDRCGQPAVRDRLCATHLADRDERRRRGALIPKCAHPGCNQQRNSESNLCTIHLRELETRRDELVLEQERAQSMEDFKERLRQRIMAAPNFEALKEVLADSVDYWIDR